MEATKTSIERAGKAVEMERIVNALTLAGGIAVDRVIDNGTLAYMIPDDPLEGRFITIKIVLTKEYDAEKLTGFDITEAISEYELKLEAEAERKLKANKKAADKATKAAKAESVKVAQ